MRVRSACPARVSRCLPIDEKANLGNRREVSVQRSDDGKQGKRLRFNPEGCDWAKARAEIDHGHLSSVSAVLLGLGHRHEKDLVDIRTAGVRAAEPLDVPDRPAMGEWTSGREMFPAEFPAKPGRGHCHPGAGARLRWRSGSRIIRSLGMRSVTGVGGASTGSISGVGLCTRVQPVLSALAQPDQDRSHHDRGDQHG